MKDMDIGNTDADADVVSDNDDDDTQGEVLRDDDEIGRVYNFPEDRMSELKDDAALQQRYQDAFEATAKTASLTTAENIAKYILQTQQ